MMKWNYLFASLLAGSAYAEFAIVQSSLNSFSIPTKNWKAIKDSRVVKQNRDFSCGAASLATILNEFYGENYSEEDFLKAMKSGDNKSNFDDMARILPSFGYKAQGFASNWEQIVQLRIPVIVYLKYRKDDHFSVIRGIGNSTVWLADPSFGNRTYSKEQFLEMWETRSSQDAIENNLKGKILAILPMSKKMNVSDFFTRFPTRQTSNAIRMLSVRSIN